MNDNRLWRRNPALSVTVAGLVALGISGLLSHAIDGTAWAVTFLLCQVAVISLIIWQSCDPFAEAAQWIGIRYRLPGSVRGATLDAIASSMPELFSGVFFVFVAMVTADEARRTHAVSEGYGAVVATCAGSAVYNMILIPAVCALVISFARRKRPTIDIAPVVITRDGMWFLLCELLLIAFLFQSSVNWWMAVVFLVLYATYVKSLYFDARQFQQAMKAADEHMTGKTSNITIWQVSEALDSAGITASRAFVTEIRNRLIDEATGDEVDDGEESSPASAKIMFGLIDVPLGAVSAWMIIVVSTIITAGTCYWLVEVTHDMAVALGVPIFFVAVILAAAASSVPDTFLSIGAALRGDDDGAVSNVFGSNIFDICVCLSLPLLVAAYFNGWQPISLTQNGNPMPGLVGIRILLCSLTIITLLIMWHNRQLTRRKALVLCSLYGLFMAYAVAGSLGYTLDKILS